MYNSHYDYGGIMGPASASGIAEAYAPLRRGSTGAVICSRIAGAPSISNNNGGFIIGSTNNIGSISINGSTNNYGAITAGSYPITFDTISSGSILAGTNYASRSLPYKIPTFKNKIIIDIDTTLAKMFIQIMPIDPKDIKQAFIHLTNLPQVIIDIVLSYHVNIVNTEHYSEDEVYNNQNDNNNMIVKMTNDGDRFQLN